MTEKNIQKRPERKSAERTAMPKIKFHIVNWLLLAAAVVVIGLGFLFLWNGSITLAPIFLVLGYCVIVPLALLLRFKGNTSDA